MDIEALSRDYSPSTRVGDIDVFLREYRDRSERARATSRCVPDVVYGPWPEARLDYFPATRPGAPLLLYVHGGYWQELSKEESAFPAPGLIASGAAFAALGYGLAPAYGIDEIVAMVGHGVRWVIDNLARLPGAPGSVHLAGMSAGAHLIAMTLATSPAGMIAGAILLSGVYDLTELRHTYINDPLGMDEATAVRNSPLSQLPDRLPPVIIARGDNEPDAFARHQTAYASAARDRTEDVTELVVAGRHHFDLPFDLSDPTTVLGRAVHRALFFPEVSESASHPPDRPSGVT